MQIRRVYPSRFSRLSVANPDAQGARRRESCLSLLAETVGRLAATHNEFFGVVHAAR